MRPSNGHERTDEQQALLLGALRRAAGAPVSYAELRDAGIEFPAGVVSELELDGVPLERCRAGAGTGVRLDPARDLPADDDLTGDGDLPAQDGPPPDDELPANGDLPANDDLTVRKAPPPPHQISGREDEPATTSGWSSVQVYRASPHWSLGRWLVPLLLVAAVVIVVVIVLIAIL